MQGFRIGGRGRHVVLHPVVLLLGAVSGLAGIIAVALGEPSSCKSSAADVVVVAAVGEKGRKLKGRN